MSDPTTEAQELLIHYMEQAGVTLSNDGRAELRRLITLIVEAAADRVFGSQAMRQLLEQHP